MAAIIYDNGKCPCENEICELNGKIWKVKFMLSELDIEKLQNVISRLQNKFDIFISSLITKEEERISEILISKKNKVIGLISIEREYSFLNERYFPTTLKLAPLSETKEIKEILLDNFKNALMSNFSISIRFYNPFEYTAAYTLSPKEFRKDINPDFFYGINPFVLANIYFSSPQSLLILFGKPGTGKSKLIQFLLSLSPEIYKRQVNVLVIKGKKALERISSDFETFLSYDIVVLDDIELTSLKRGENEEVSNFISTLLSATDSFIPKQIKVIISTNQRFKEIDPALLRPSRLFDILELKEIDKTFFQHLLRTYPELEKAKSLFKETDKVSIAMIIEKITEYTKQDYLTDQRISRRNESFQRNIGF